VPKSPHSEARTACHPESSLTRRQNCLSPKKVLSPGARTACHPKRFSHTAQRSPFHSAQIAKDPTQKAVFPNYTSEVAKTDIFTSFAWGGVGMTSLIHGINTHLSDLSTHPVHTGSLFEIFLMVALEKRFALTGKSQ